MKTTDDLWAEMSAPLRRFIRGRVEDDSAAEDLLQDIFVRIHQNMPGLRNDERVESWMYQIARHAIIDHYRARKSHTALTDGFPDPSDWFNEPDASEELCESVLRLVEALPEPYRQALRLTEYEGISQRELAIRQGISLSGAKSRVQRARQMIKDELLACCHFEFDRYGRIIDFWENCCCCSSKNG